MSVLFNSRGGPMLRSWILCALISLGCVDANYFNVIPRIYPEGVIIIKYGNPLEIFCVADKNSTSNDIEFMLAGNRIKSEIVNGTTRRLYISKPKKQVSTYHCKNIKTRKICVSRIIVDSSPEPINDWSCISKNVDTLSCSWTSSEMVSSENNSLLFSINDKYIYPACEVKEERNRRRMCVWNTTSRPRYRQMLPEQKFYLTSCNIIGCINQNFTIDHYAIVKPDPPKQLRVVNYGPHSANLQWRLPNNILDFCRVDHKIQYRIANIDNIADVHTIDTSRLPSKNTTYSLNISNLPYAYMQYEVRVYIKTKEAVREEFWSNYSYVNFYTASEKPSRAPELIVGSFDQGTYNNARFIRLYWKQLEEYEEAGPNFTYKVVVSQGNESQTLFPDKNKSLGYVLFNATSNDMDVTVWSMNAIDCSNNSSHLYIPSEKDVRALRTSSFTKLAYDNGTYELSWQRIQDIDNYTIIWCQRNGKKGKICAKRIDFVVLDSQKSTHIIDLPRNCYYEFALSVNKGTKSSGMVWAKTVEGDFVIDL